MPHKFSLAHLSVLSCAPPEMAYIAAMAGYDYISIRPIFMGLKDEPNYDLANNPKMLKDTKTALKETGIGVHDIELAKIEKGRDVKQYEPAMAVAAELGAQAVLSSVWTDDKEFYTEQFAQLCDIAQKYNLTVNLEFVTWANIFNLKGAKKLLDAVDKDNARIMIDTLHFHRSRVSYEELAEIPQKYFHFAHLCDAPGVIPDTKEELVHTGRDERLYVGEGEISIAEIIKYLPEGITFSLEIPHLERVKVLGNAEHARRCLLSAKEYLKKHDFLKRLHEDE